VPPEVAEKAAALRERLRTLAATAPGKFASDLQTAEALAQASFTGAVANVRINLASMKDEALLAPIQERLAKLS
jgi:glutamate formiminotransferase / formiminotetrahydrofolate cyclodeaminase